MYARSNKTSPVRASEPPIGQEDILMDYYGGTPPGKKPRRITSTFKTTSTAKEDKEVADDEFDMNDQKLEQEIEKVKGSEIKVDELAKIKKRMQ